MISKLSIRNYKVLKDVELFLSDLTVVTGINSMGKSSLIQVLLLLRQSYEKGTLEKRGLLLNGDYLKVGTGKDIFSISAEENEYLDFDIEWLDDTVYSCSFEYDDKSNLQPLKKSSESNYKQSLFNAKFQYLSADRLAPNSIFPVSDYDVNTLHNLGSRGEFTAHFIAQYGLKDISLETSPVGMKELIHPKSKSNTLLAQIDAWMSEISPGIKVSAEVIPSVNQASLQYEFEMKNDYSDKFRPENVGFGLTFVLPIVTAVLSAKKGDLLIIENPEAHLHPAGQTAIAKLISQASYYGLQIIIETHSDHFLNAVRLAVKKKIITHEKVSIFYFTRSIEDDEFSVSVKEPYIDENGKLSEWPKGFFDEWEKNIQLLIET